MSANGILKMKVNIWGTLAIAIVASITTTFALEWIRFDAPASSALSASNLTTASLSVLDCDEGVYSPVQRKCVLQAVFDAEMNRLFAALGLDTSIYRSNPENAQ